MPLFKAMCGCIYHSMYTTHKNITWHHSLTHTHTHTWELLALWPSLAQYQRNCWSSLTFTSDTLLITCARWPLLPLIITSYIWKVTTLATLINKIVMSQYHILDYCIASNRSGFWEYTISRAHAYNYRAATTSIQYYIHYCY